MGVITPPGYAHEQHLGVSVPSRYTSLPRVVTLSSPEKLIWASRASREACSLRSPGLGVYYYPNMASKFSLRSRRPCVIPTPTFDILWDALEVGGLGKPSEFPVLMLLSPPGSPALPQWRK